MKYNEEIGEKKSYQVMAEIYDWLMQSVDYEAWADYVGEIVKKFGIKTNHLVDLACGTGNSTFPFAKRGIPITGIDYSIEMLQIGRRKMTDDLCNIDFIYGDLRNLPAKNHTFSLALHYQDGLNYLLNEKDLEKAFNGVYRLLTDEGFFVFDFNFPGYYRRVLGESSEEVYKIEEEGFNLIWESNFYEQTGIREIRLTFEFLNENNINSNLEIHREKEYSLETIFNLLSKVGFYVEDIYPTFKFKKPLGEEPRVTIIARKKAF